MTIRPAPRHAPYPIRGVDDVNRNFDLAWREAYGVDDNPDGTSQRSHAGGNRLGA